MNIKKEDEKNEKSDKDEKEETKKTSRFRGLGALQEKEALIRGLELMFLDIVLLGVSMALALWIRHDFRFMDVDPEFFHSLYRYMPFNIVISLIIFHIFRFYTSLWRFASVEELKNIILGVVFSTLLQMIGMGIGNLRIPRSYPFLYGIILFILMIISRFSYRVMRIARNNSEIRRKSHCINTMIVGAGSAGFMIVREMKNSKHLNRKICCVVDDNPQKVGTYLQGAKVEGRKEDIPALAKKYDVEEIVIAIPTLGAAAKKELLNICQETNCKILLLPGIYQLVNEDVSVSMLREVDINDLLGRPPVQLKMSEIMGYVQDKTILVTGGGGSIGSELCRQVAMHQPKLLIILDIYENNAYDIRNELLKKYPDLNLEVLIGSVRNKKRIDTIFDTYRPEIVFHAAAHKHVPLMEDSPNESIKNNVLGTWNVANAAHEHQVKKMVLISTDKAVRPTNIMGASKRLCELVIQSFAQRSRTEYAAVRFGNVLGSNGSVVPLFRKQIAAGGPVTVTHPEIIRYFMTIPEAVNLVLQCGALAKGGEVFILDMGEPVKIVDLAYKMIRLSGFVPDEDIKVCFTGLRPGEKLYEELLISEKNLKKTEKDRIFVAQQEHVDEAFLQKKLEELVTAAYDETNDIRHKVQELVPEYTFKTEEE